MTPPHLNYRQGGGFRQGEYEEPFCVPYDGV
jgi:hypothetical protein